MAAVKFETNMLCGAREIAEYIFGPGAKPQRVYDLRRRSRFPHYRIGSVLYARKSDIDSWIDAQVASNCNEPPPANDA